LAALLALEVRGGAAVYLSDLKARKYESTPFVGAPWPLANGANASGGALRLAGQLFDKGLGMHTASRVVYALDGSFAWFEAVVGLDEIIGRRGRARVRVLVDEQPRPLPEGGKIQGQGVPLTIRLDVRGAKELTLEVMADGFG